MPPCIPPECEPFDHPGFWHKLWAFAKRAGRPFIETCLLLYYTSQKDDLPLWAKLLICQSASKNDQGSASKIDQG